MVWTAISDIANMLVSCLPAICNTHGHAMLKIHCCVRYINCRLDLGLLV